ncbi:MAG: polyketide synthase [Candidatus Synoicihabitans palmerolidicus]|nr:polyketide synthase [Candidatus Synoicihabitans palmerolidicus]
MAGRLGTGLKLSEEEEMGLSAAVPAVSEYTIVGQQLNMIAANVSEAFDFTGPALTVDTACSSALVALHEGVGHLRSGQVDAALVRGVYVLLDPMMMVCFSRVGALSRTDECLPFAERANGFVLGEGVGMVVLKRWADAKRDGDPIVVVIEGMAVNNDGKGGGPFTSLGTGQRAVLADAWKDAQRDPKDVAYVAAHGTATPVGDRVELEALRGHFTDVLKRGPVGLGAVKAHIGHAVAAAGMASLNKGALSLREGRLSGQPGAPESRPQVEAAGFVMAKPTRAWARSGCIGVNAFGFGGTNAHLVLTAAPTRCSGRDTGAMVAWAFSAPDKRI